MLKGRGGCRQGVPPLAAALALGMLLSACSGSAATADGEGETRGGSAVGAAGGARPVSVVASTTIFVDLVEQVGGASVRVRSLAPANADAHTFTLSPGDVRALRDAELVVLGGAGLEASFEDAVEENARGMVVRLAEGLPLAARASGTEEAGRYEPGHNAVDPHFWMEIDFVIASVERIRGALAELRPAARAVYSVRADAYIGELRALDREIRALLSGLPAERRSLFTFHDAFGYFARRYGLTVEGFVVEGSEEEPSARDVAATIERMWELDVRLIFAEPQHQASVLDQIARETKAEVRNLHSESLSEAAPTYVEMMRANAHAIAD